MWIVIQKKNRRLLLVQDGRPVFECPIALGREPMGPKRCEGDGRTPEGVYFICLVKEQGKYGRSLGLSYPNEQDAASALSDSRIDSQTHVNIVSACRERRRPPWGSPLGGEIYIHEGGSQTDWTQGCIALEESDMDQLFPLRDQVDEVIILP